MNKVFRTCHWTLLSLMLLLSVVTPSHAQLAREYFYLGDRMFASLGVGNERPVSISVTPPAASGAGPSTLTFTFRDFDGVNNLGVVNGLINTALDGRNACYFAYSRPDNLLYLVNDLGDNAATMPLPPQSGAAFIENSQCRIYSSGSGVNQPPGTDMTLSLSIQFFGSFTGRKAVYLAARDATTGNSGWQPLGVTYISTPITSFRVDSLAVPRGTGGVASAVPLELTVSSSAGFGSIEVINLLINSALDGTRACFLAYTQSDNVLYLVKDTNGDLITPGLSPSGGQYTGNSSNSQCELIGQGSTYTKSGNSITFKVNIRFAGGFGGNRIVYANARGPLGNSDWQIIGTWTVQ
jgi:hypothetical protein